MTGPRMIGIRDVTDPYEGLQESVSRVGDIYQNYEKDRRASELHASQMAEVDFVNRKRKFVSTYEPELGGENFLGIDDTSKKALQIEEAEVLRQREAAGATPEELATVRQQLIDRRKLLATKEGVFAKVYSDFIKAGFEPASAEANANAYASRFYSIEDAAKTELDRYKTEQERLLSAATIAIEAMKARMRGDPGVAINNGSPTTSNKVTGAGGGTTTIETVGELNKYYQDMVDPSWAGFPILGALLRGDSKEATKMAFEAVNAVNRKRTDAGVPAISMADVGNFLALAINNSGFDSVPAYASSEEMVVDMEKYLEANGITNTPASDIRTSATATPEENAAILTALRGVSKGPESRDNLAMARAYSVYKDLYVTLKNTKGNDNTSTVSGSGSGNTGQNSSNVSSGGNNNNNNIRILAGTVDEDNSQLEPVRSPVPVDGRLPPPVSAPKSKEDFTSEETDRLNKIEAEIVAINSDSVRKAISGRRLRELERERGWILNGEWTARNNLEKTTRELDQVTNALQQRNRWPLKNAKVLADIEELQQEHTRLKQEHTRLTRLLRTQREEARRLTSAGVRASNSPVDVNLELGTLLTQPSGSGRLQNVTSSPSTPASQDNTVVEESPAVAASPELEKARVEAILAALSDPGASIPKELTEARFPAQVMYQISRFTPEQINSLDANIGKELTTYDALANYARLSGNTKRLAEIEQEVRKLNRLRTTIDPRVTEKSTSTSTRIPLTGGTAAEAVEDLSSLANVPNEAGRITTPVDSLLNVTGMTNEQAAEAYDYISGRIPDISQALMNARANGDIRTQLSLERELLALERTKLQIESKLGKNSIGTRLPSR